MLLRVYEVIVKTVLLVILAAGIGVTAGGLIVSERGAKRHAAALAAQHQALNAEIVRLEAALEAANARPAPAPFVIPPNPAPAALGRLSPAEIMDKLQTLKGSSSRTLRESVYWLAELAQHGQTALPAIREFLARNEDVDLDALSAPTRGARDVRVPLDFVLPPSLRFGLFDVLRQIGSAEAEQILAESLTLTSRGVEVAYLARVLQDMAPNKYREQATSLARQLLATAASFSSPSPLDRNHRDNLFSVLMMYNDTSFAGDAQGQLVQADGQIDRGSLKYLQQVLGPQSVAIAAQAYQDPRVSDSAKKEPLARLALSFVGVDQQANEFYERTINDPVITPSHRKNLIEDLNEDGLEFRNLTERDLPTIKNRLAIIDQLAPSAMDKVNAAAFMEARKDLVNMANRILNPPPPKP